MFPGRGHLWLPGRRGSGSAFAADAVARCGLEGFAGEVPLVRTALLPLHARRIVQAAPWLSDSALHPLAWATMASAGFSPHSRNRLRPPAPVARRSEEISQGRTPILPSNAAGFTDAVSVWLIDFPVRSRVISPRWPCIRFRFVNSGVCRRLPSRPTSRRRGCHWLTVPANRPVEDSHLQDRCHAWHTSRVAGLGPAMDRGKPSLTAFTRLPHPRPSRFLTYFLI